MSPNAETLPPRAWIPTLASAANIGCGFAATLLAADGRFDAAVYLLVVAILLDVADGRLARMLGATSRFGQQLDSFSDLLSFGAAPALLVYQALLRPLGALGIATALLYLFAGVYRLTRFNLSTDAHASKSGRTTGVPIPIGAGYLMAVALMRDRLTPVWAAAVVLAMAGLMITRWRLPELKGKGLVSGMLLLGIANYFAVVFQPNWYTVGWWNAWNVIILIAARREERQLRPHPG